MHWQGFQNLNDCLPKVYILGQHSSVALSMVMEMLYIGAIQ